MTLYGLGAVALYKGDLDRAEALLARACNESTMVEPHILLSQLYWKHRAATRADAADVAVRELQHVIERAVLLAKNAEIDVDLFPPKLLQAREGEAPNFGSTVAFFEYSGVAIKSTKHPKGNLGPLK
jgi:DNA-binding NtrC family response regulator